MTSGFHSADAFAERFISFWAAPSGARLAELFCREAVIRWPGEPQMSLTAYMTHMDAMLTALPDLRIKVEDHAGRRDVVFISWRAQASFDAHLRQWTGIDKFRLRNDLAVEEDVVFDRATVRALRAPRA